MATWYGICPIVKTVLSNDDGIRFYSYENGVSKLEKKFLHPILPASTLSFTYFNEFHPTVSS